LVNEIVSHKSSCAFNNVSGALKSQMDRNKIKPPKRLKPGEEAVFAANPYYDELLLFADIEVPTTQEFYKLVDSEKELYQKIKKDNVKDFQKKIKERLLNKRKPWWPFTDNISVGVTISGPKKYIETKDLDNFLKTIFDTIKGVVILDDHQITEVTVDKSEIPFVSGLLISIRVIRDNEDYKYGQDPDRWEQDRQLKLSRGGICCMDSY
jgi:Holliday junction resolvase RusA-like endonuclease